MSIIRVISKYWGVLMKRRTMRAIKQGSSTVLALTGFLDLGKEYTVNEISDGKKNYIIITEAIFEPLEINALLRGI